MGSLQTRRDGSALGGDPMGDSVLHPVLVVSALSNARPVPAVGQVVDGRFQLERELGAGGMGTVYEAMDLTTGKRVALKLMRPELADDPRALERFRREAAALAAIRHASVVEIREVGALEDGSLYLAMELLEGETLGERLERVGRMNPEQLLPIVLGLCDGLGAVHAGGVIHRDIKPSNIHLPSADVLARAERTHERAPVKIVDFGVARVSGFSKMTSTGLAIGTVRYMAPEQLTGSAIDERADIYALGVVLYEALAGEHPFLRTAAEDPVGAILVGRATPLSSLRPELPPSVTRVVHTAMARVATDRFASTRALADAFLRSVLEPDAPVGDDATRTTPSARADLERAPTLLATPAAERVEVPTESRIRAKREPKGKRPPLWLLLPLVTGVCLVPTLGVAGFLGCGGWMTGVQMDVALSNVRAAVEADPSLEHFGADLDTLESLHAGERVNLFAAAAFNARVQHALRSENSLDSEEVVWIMEVARDVNARHGDYTLDRYSEMTNTTRTEN